MNAQTNPQAIPVDSTQNYFPQRPGLDGGIDVFAYLLALFKARYYIVAVALLSGALGYAYSFTKPELYETFVRTDLIDIEDPGGVSPDNRRASEVLTLVEHGFVLSTSKDNYLDVMMAKMRSRQFTLFFMEKHGVFQAFFPEQWNESTGDWNPGFTPDRGSSFLRFNEQIRFIDHNPENDIISIRMRWINPAQARDWSNSYVKEFNHFMREQALNESASKRAYLEQELTRTTVVDIRQSLFRLIEAQTAVAMLANSKEEFVLEVIDPALLPFHRHSPGRKTYLILGTFMGGMLCIAFVFARIMFADIKRAIERYQVHPNLITP